MGRALARRLVEAQGGSVGGWAACSGWLAVSAWHRSPTRALALWRLSHGPLARWRLASQWSKSPDRPRRTTMSLVIWMAVAIAVVFAISLYNSLVSVKNAVSKAWANIDVLLKQRHDELPKLVDTCKQYMQHEQTTLERVIQARTRVADAREAKNIGALGAAESALRSGLGSLLALVESYPELKANEQFLHLQSRISGLENAIADRREFYNESVNINNVSIEQFPQLLIARCFKFKPFELLQFETEELQDVDIRQRFGS
jgi:LemA protein